MAARLSALPSQVIEALHANTLERTREVLLIFERPASDGRASDGHDGPDGLWI